ncbi:MAG: hypothetical protein R2774_04200 [Saprospiraceae bacterium]
MTFLERFVSNPLGDNTDLSKLHVQNPEWTLFSLAYTVYAVTNMSMMDTTFRNQAINITDQAIQKIKSERVFSTYFGDKNPLSPEIDSIGSVLYFGHLNLVLSCYRLLTQDDRYNALHDSLSLFLYRRFTQSKFLNLESYPQNIWIPDNIVALASLHLHSKITGSEYGTVTNDWVLYAKSNLLDKESGLLVSKINSYTGKMEEGTRGSMLGWSILFMNRFDSLFARQQYEIFKSKFTTNVGIFRLCQERYKTYTSDIYGDIDSGPILFGYSIPSITFCFGNALAFKDLVNAKRLKRVINLGLKEVNEKDELYYKTKFVNLNYSPLAEAMLLYLETYTEWRILGNR